MQDINKFQSSVKKFLDNKTVKELLYDFERELKIICKECGIDSAKYFLHDDCIVIKYFIKNLQYEFQIKKKWR